MVAGKHAVASGRPFEEDFRRAIRVQHQAEGEAAIAAKREAFHFPELFRQGVEAVAKGGHGVVAAIGAVAKGEWIGGVGRAGVEVGGQGRQPP